MQPSASCCGCPFADSPGLISGSCGSGLALFMGIVETLILSQCNVTDPCRRLGVDSAESPPLPTYDFVVVGAGVAGSVVASRLSAPTAEGTPPWSVLLLEAGPEEPSATQVPTYSVSAVGTRFDWGFTTQPQERACLANGGRCRWPRGKMVSGTGGMNGLMYTRGNKRIFDEWNVDGWSFDEVLPYFKKSESNRNHDLLDDGYHGFDGPLPVQTFSYHPPLAEDIVRAGIEVGYRNGDVNGRNQTGFAIAQMMTDDGKRASTSRVYLRPQHNRPNIRVATGAHVTRVLFQGKRAVGVEYVDSTGNSTVVRASKEVILSAGAIGTPQILMLSGIGPGDHLAELGIPVVADLPGVGKNLHNHVSTRLKFTISRQDYRMLDLEALQSYATRREGPMASTGLTQVTGFMVSKYQEDWDFPDLQFFFDGYSASCSMTGRRGECSGGEEGDCGRRTIGVRPTNVLPESRGFLRLGSADPFAQPEMNPGYFDSEKDLWVLVEGIKLGINLTRTEALKTWGFNLNETRAEGCEEHDFGSDEYWACFVMRYTGPENHQGGTAKMGNDDDPEAVLDPRLMVRGVGNLRVVDASIFPRIPNSNPISSIVMAAEKLSDMLWTYWEEVEGYNRLKKYPPQWFGGYGVV